MSFMLANSPQADRRLKHSTSHLPSAVHTLFSAHESLCRRGSGYGSGVVRSPLACLVVLFLITACEGSIVTPGKLPPGAGGGTAMGTGGGSVVITPDAGPVPCEPGTQQVPKLLRLSNHEYQTIASDVLGVPLPASLFTRWTPVAQVYGFDTMSETRIDAQGLEEQLATAESLASLVLATPALTAHCPAVLPAQTPACPLKPVYSAMDDFSDTQGRDCWSYVDSSGAPMVFDNANARWRKAVDQGVYLWRTGAHPGGTVDAVRRWLSPVDGALSLTGAFNDGDPTGGDGVTVSIRKNGTPVFSQDLPKRGRAPFTLSFAVARNDQLEFVVNRKTNTSYDSTGFAVSMTFTQTPRKQAWTWSACVEPLVTRLASRSFRRPIRADELADYQALFNTSLQGATTAGFTEPVDEALSAVLQAVFLSPNVVFKPEFVPGGLDPSERGYGVASRLSLYFRSSIADEPLWTLAGSGGLSTPDAIRAQANRLLDENRDRFTHSFGGQWLDFRETTLTGPLAASMQKESHDVFAAVVQADLPVEKLLRPGFTIVDAPLASHYGLFVPGMGAGRVTTTERGGVLSQAGFLMSTANGTEFRRPIHRGIWVLQRLLCRPLPKLDAATLEEIGNSFNTINRSLPLPEQMKLHRDSTNRCGGCHNSIDPVGLSLEKYDPQGKWRTTYADGAPIVTSLELDGRIVRDPHELAQAIEANPDYRKCVADKLLTFGLNRGPRENEACVMEELGRPKNGTMPGFKTMTVDALMKAMELTEVTP